MPSVPGPPCRTSVAKTGMSTVSGADIMLTMPSKPKSVRIGIEPVT